MGFVTLNVPLGDVRFGKSFECPDCHGGPEMDKIRERQRAEMLHHLTAAGLTTTDRHDRLTWKNFTRETLGDLYAGKGTAIELAQLWASGQMISYNSLGADHALSRLYPTSLGFEQTRNLYLVGDFGTGKTALARLAMRDYLQHTGRNGLFIEWSALYEAIKAQYSREENDAYPLLHAAATVPILLLDDIGQARQTRPVGDDEYKKLWHIIDHRYRHRELETLITSNLDRHQMADQYDAKIAGRLAEMCVIVEMGGIGFREYDRAGTPGYDYKRAASGEERGR